MEGTDASWKKAKILGQKPRNQDDFIGRFKIPNDKRVSRAKNRRIDFFIAGTQKGGTSALDAYMRLNPAICMPQKKKEVNFFNADGLFGSGGPDYRLYHSFFKPKKTHRLLGEATPDYMYHDLFAQRLHAYNPGAKIILSLRNPIDRAFSNWNMARALGDESLSFGMAIRSEEERRRAARQENKLDISCHVDRGYYVEQIRRIRRYFPPRQILVVKQEDLLNHPKTTLDAIWEFLGVEGRDPVVPLTKLVGHYPAPMDEADRDYLKGLYQYEIRSLEQMLGWDCSDWLA